MNSRRTFENTLEGLPVKARSSTIIYRGTKFLHRHKDTAVAVGALLALVSALAIGGFLYSRRAPIHVRNGQT
ncbi:MAG: hypothetical protein WCA20_17590 [Candidatus Sulfotelmatobacter sp.]